MLISSSALLILQIIPISILRIITLVVLFQLFGTRSFVQSSIVSLIRSRLSQAITDSSFSRLSFKDESSEIIRILNSKYSCSQEFSYNSCGLSDSNPLTLSQTVSTNSFQALNKVKLTIQNHIVKKSMNSTLGFTQPVIMASTKADSPLLKQLMNQTSSHFSRVWTDWRIS